MKEPVILIVDDEAPVRLLLTEIAKKEGFVTQTAENGQEAVDLVRSECPDLVFMDIRMPVLDGMAAFDIMHEAYPDLPVVLLTAYGTVDIAVEAMHKGAFDYLVKPADVVEIRAVMNRVLAIWRMREELDGLRRETGLWKAPDKIVGRSAAMQNLYKMVTRVAASSATVLITGESGSGKELIAKTIHANSPRAGGRFVKVNCGALPENLIESELFGYEKGAFTGAVARKLGRFDLAHGGTLFLDEIGDLPLAMQVKLLRVLQEQTFERVGGVETVQVNVRVLAATNKDLSKMAEAGAFRKDLFYRLNVVPVKVPPLRERREDIPLLAEHFLQLFANCHHCEAPVMTEAALRELVQYDWPGNVRDLANVLERAVILSQGILDVEDFSFLAPAALAAAPGSDEAFFDSLLNRGTLKEMLAEVERRILLHVLNEVAGNQSQAALRLGMSRRNLIYKLHEHDLIRQEEA